MKRLNKGDFLKSIKPVTKEVQIEALGGATLIAPLSLSALLDFSSRHLGNDKASEKAMRISLIAASVVDEKGEALLTEKEVETIFNQRDSSLVKSLNQLVTECFEINGLSSNKVDDAKKKQKIPT